MLTIATAVLLAISLPVAGEDGAPVGVIVSDVDPESPAASAGIERGDLILGINGQDLGSARDLVLALAEAEGSVVTLSIKHGDEKRDQVVVIDRIWGRPRIGLAIAGAGASIDLRPWRGQRLPMPPKRPGFLFRNEPDKLGVVVIKVVEGSVAANMGLQAGDWITAVGRLPLDGLAGELEEIIGSYKPGAEVSIGYQRHGEEMTATVILGADPETGAAMLGIRYKPLPKMEDMYKWFGEKDMYKRFDEKRERFERR